MRERAREQRDSEGRMASVVEQTLGAMPAVQAFTREDTRSGTSATTPSGPSAPTRAAR